MEGGSRVDILPCEVKLGYIRIFYIEWVYKLQSLGIYEGYYFSYIIVFSEDDIISLERRYIKTSIYFGVLLKSHRKFCHRNYFYCSIFLHFYKYISPRTLFHYRIVAVEIKERKRLQEKIRKNVSQSITKETNTSYPCKTSWSRYHINRMKFWRTHCILLQILKYHVSQLWRLISLKWKTFLWSHYSIMHERNLSMTPYSV